MAAHDGYEGTKKFDPALLRDPEPAAADETDYLVMVAGAQPGLRVEITAQPVSIGRSEQQSLVFATDAELSRRHAQVCLRNGSTFVEDLGSTNGTFVNGSRINGAQQIAEGAVIKVGGQSFKYERRSREDVRQTEQLDRDLARASSYVMALLPEPQAAGGVRTDWKFVPSARLGGDAFGYFWLDDRAFAIFLIDVSGHGVGAAIHSVSVLNVLRQRALPGVDWNDPGRVLATLNDRFQMDSHNGMLFTAWYGVYDTHTRTIAYSAAGHHAAYLVTPGSPGPSPLGVKAMMIGAVPGLPYPVERAPISAGSRLYVFSDGVFEITTATGAGWTIADFLPLLTASPAAGLDESERLYRAVHEAAAHGVLEDDFSIVVATFP
jgi:serine phosphatase RsbU (regulator of sigma subunit)